MYITQYIIINVFIFIRVYNLSLILHIHKKIKITSEVILNIKLLEK